MENNLMSRQQLQDYLGISRSTYYRYRDRKQLPEGFRLVKGGKLFFNREQVVEWEKSKSAQRGGV